VNSSGGSPDGATSANGSGGLGVNVVGGGGGGGYVGGGAGAGAASGCVGGGGGGGGSSWLSDSMNYGQFNWPGAGSGAAIVTFVDPTDTTLTSSNNPSVVGELVTFTAAVTTQGSPVFTGSGEVTFRNGATVLAAGVVVDEHGEATFSTSALPVGVHTITATFSGSTSQTSTATLEQEVLAEPPVAAVTATGLSSSLNPSVVGDSVSFLAEVTSEGSPVTVGTVDFEVDGVVIAGGVALDAGGFAGVSTSALAVGTRVVVATYNGTPEFASSSATLDQVVDDVAPEPEPEPEPEPGPDPVVGPTPPPAAPPSVLAASGPGASTPTGPPASAASANPVLPVTGSSVVSLAFAALALIAVGALALLEARLRSRSFDRSR
jgi:hypothetical protein